MTDSEMPEAIYVWKGESTGNLYVYFEGVEGVSRTKYTRTASSQNGLVECLGKVQDWLGEEIFDADTICSTKDGSTQEERAENISDVIREALAEHRKVNRDERK